MMSSQTIYSNLSNTNVTSQEFSLFMGLDSIVSGAPKNYDLYSDELTLVELVGSCPQEIKKSNQENQVSFNDKKAPTDKNQSSTDGKKGVDELNVPIVEDGLKILFPNESKKRKYTKEQVQQLLYLVLVSKMNANQASQICEINPSTGYGYVKQVKDALNIKKTVATVDEKEVAKKPGNQKLFEEHYKFLAQLFQDDEFATLKSAKEALEAKFPGLVVSTSCIHDNLRRNCTLVVRKNGSMKPVATLASNMVFEDEILIGMSFFTIYLRNSFGWSRGCDNSGEPLSARLSGIKVPLMVAFSKKGIIKLSVLSPSAFTKKDAFKNCHELFLKFLEQVLSVEDKISLYNTFVVEEEWMSKGKKIGALTQEKKYKCVYRQTDFIASFFHNLQLEMRRQPLSEEDPLLPRFQEAAKRVKWL